MSRSRELTYEKALVELEAIVSRIESEETDIDSLSEQVKRASEIIAFCRNRLRSTEEEVRKVLAGIDRSAPEEGG